MRTAMIERPLLVAREEGGGDDAQFFKLVKKPDSTANSLLLLKSLAGCEGHMEELPLRRPNVDQKDLGRTVSDMVNILTIPKAASEFSKAAKLIACLKDAPWNDRPRDRRHQDDGTPHAIYDYDKSAILKFLLKSAQRNTSHARAPGTLVGHVVKPGCISFYTHDEKTFAAPEGRWYLRSLKSRWTRTNVHLNQDIIGGASADEENMRAMIIRVKPGEVGLITEQGEPVILGTGTHVFNSGAAVAFKDRIAYSSTIYFNHGPYHYLRVHRGNFAKVWVEVKGKNGIVSLVPRLLGDGEHFVKSHQFRYGGWVNASKVYIKHGSVHRIQVKKGYVAKVVYDKIPRLLGEGDHVIESNDFSFVGMEDLKMNLQIVHETITIFQVARGQVALAWHYNEPIFIDKPGVYEFDSPNFRFVEMRNAGESLIQLGPYKIVHVRTGEVGVTFEDGVLSLLPHGRHIIRNATHIFHRFLSTQQKTIRLGSHSANAKRPRPQKSTEMRLIRGPPPETRVIDSCPSDAHDLIICETKDFIKVGFQADLFYSITDPEKCIQKIDIDELEDFVRNRAVATLTNIIRSAALNEIAPSKAMAAVDDGIANSFRRELQMLPLPAPCEEEEHSHPPPPYRLPLAMFFERAHEEFMYRLHDDFLIRYGINIANIQIDSFKIMDDGLSEQMLKNALSTFQIENDMANMERHRVIALTKEKTEADMKTIGAEADAAAMKKMSLAEKERIVEAALAEAETIKIAARAKAAAEMDAILARAEAEAEAIRLKAHAMAEGGELVCRGHGLWLAQQSASSPDFF